jgi:hypothetical protein
MDSLPIEGNSTVPSNIVPISAAGIAALDTDCVLPNTIRDDAARTAEDARRTGGFEVVT